MSIFKAYDIRGIYPEELDEKTAWKIGAAFARFLGAKKLVVGRDMRTMAPSIEKAAVEGILSTGCDVLRIGLSSTPMAYFAIGKLPCDGGMNVTASHNPPQYIGFKLCREGARPLSGDTGIQKIREMVESLPEGGAAPGRGEVTEVDVREDYVKHVLSFAEEIRPMTICVDYANGMGAYVIPRILDALPQVKVHALYDELDGTFPNHEANPLKEENLEDLRKLVLETGADLGVEFDGDADRCAFMDGAGKVVSSDLITAILARDLLEKHPGKGILYDIRSSRVVPEEIRRLGGRPVRERVGHSFMKETMRREDCAGGGELSGHYYFADNYFSDSGIIALIKIMNVLTKEGKTLKEVADALRKYPSTGEINFRVEDKEGLMKKLAEVYKDGKQDWLDGITVSYPDWWFNVRPSNTEPYLRLVLEADNEELLEKKKKELIALLGQPV